MRKILLLILLVASSVVYGQANKETLFLINSSHTTPLFIDIKTFQQSFSSLLIKWII